MSVPFLASMLLAVVMAEPAHADTPKARQSRLQQVKAFCTVACQHPDGYVPTGIFARPTPTSGTPASKARIKACMHGLFDDWGNSYVCPRMCPYFPDPLRTCIPDLIQTQSCGTIAICRVVGTPEQPEEADEYSATLRCAVGVDRFAVVRLRPHDPPTAYGLGPPPPEFDAIATP